MKMRTLIELMLLAALFGPSFLFIKLGVAEMSPFTLVAARATIAAVVLYVALKLRRQRLPRSGKMWWHIGVTGFFAMALPFTLFAFGEMRVSSAMAGVINGFTPIAAAVMAHFAFSDERLTLSRSAGVLFGMSGFAILLAPQIISAGLHGDAWGVLLIGIGATSYAVGAIYGRKYVRHLPPLLAPTGGLMITACILVPLALIAEPFFDNAPLSYMGIIAVAELSLVGTAAAMTLYFRVLRHSGASTLTMFNYLLPFYGTLIGFVALGERMAWTAYLAGGLIICGMMFVNGTIKLPGTRKEVVPIPIDSDPGDPPGGDPDDPVQ